MERADVRHLILPLITRVVVCVVLVVGLTACARTPATRVLTADMPLHLEDHLDAATFSQLPAGGVAPTSHLSPIEWRFDQPQPDWKATLQWPSTVGAAVLARTAEGLRVTLNGRTRPPGSNRVAAAGVHVDLPAWTRDEWADVIIRARAGRTSTVAGMGLRFNLREDRESATTPQSPYEFSGENSGVIRDGEVHTYRLRADWSSNAWSPDPAASGAAIDRPWAGPWRQLALWFWLAPGGEPGSIELLSVTVVPKGAAPPPTTVEWRFDEPQPDWKVVLPDRSANSALQPARIERTADALRVTLPEGSRQGDGLLHGGISVDLPGWRREEWAHVIVRARSAGSVRNMTISTGQSTPLVSDGSVQTYEVRVNWRSGTIGQWLQAGLDFAASEPGSVDILSVSVVPIAALYAQDPHGARSINVAGTYRRSLFTHAPSRIEYQVRVSEGGRLQTALGVLDAHVPVEFRISARPARGDATPLLTEAYADPDTWAERSVDLSRFAGQTITLWLDTYAKTAGTVAFWGSPTMTGPRRTDKPNVILYVIDGGGADYMSVYGYNRRTTPNLEKLAAEGALFEHVYSNAGWTKQSTTSFMTSLQSSVLGSTGISQFEPLPEQAVTMAEHLHRAGYATGVFTSNPWAAALSGLERGVDLLPRPRGSLSASSMSSDLHQAFWSWRRETPAQPYWAHFQTTDVHHELPTVSPFAGLFVGPGELQTRSDGQARLRDVRLVEPTGPYTGWGRLFSEDFKKAGVSRTGFYAIEEALYGEAMAHNDYQLGRLIDRLKAEGEWEHTLLIVAADHSVQSAQLDLSLAQLETLPPLWSEAVRGRAGPMFRPSNTRVPLIVVWPGHIKGGQRFEPPVSLIDLLPTVLELTGLPRPDVMQGQSLAPLLRGEPGWTPRPVILDEFEIDPATGEVQGRLEVVDGRWGASMWIGPPPQAPRPPRPTALLLYDLWNDPVCLTPVNEQHPDLVQKYTKFLEDTWKDHQALATRFKRGTPIALTPEQLERLRALGYVQ